MAVEVQDNMLDETLLMPGRHRRSCRLNGLVFRSTNMLETEADKLLNMEERLHERIVGQKTRLFEALSDAIRRSRSGLSDPRRPIGSFIFLGQLWRG